MLWLADDAEAEAFPPRSRRPRRRRPVRLEVEVLHGSYDVPGARLLDLVTVMDRLRAECPWDREQTHRSLARYLLEETYETLEAIDGFPATRLAPARGAGRPAAAGLLPCPDRRRATRTASRSTTSPRASSTSWCTGTRTSSRASTSPTRTRWSATGRRSRRPRRAAPRCSTASRRRCRRWRWPTRRSAARRRPASPPDPAPKTLGGRLLDLVVEARAAGARPGAGAARRGRRLAADVRATESR